MKFLLNIVIVLSTFFCFGQNTTLLDQHELILDSLLRELRAARNDEQKDSCNSKFKKSLELFVQNEQALTHSFTKLKTVGIIDSPDELVRIINWNVERDNMEHDYFCYVLRYDKRKKKYKVSELKDVSFGMPSQPSGMLTENDWYGALYYKIIPIKKGSRQMYTLLGWDHNSSMSQMKLIDVMYFSGTKVKLGSPVFKMGGSTSYRLFFEHSKKTSMYLNYESSRKRIMMDHLSPESPALKDFRSFYVPDLSYDSFTFTGNKWVLKEDVIGVNEYDGEGQKQTIYVQGRSGEIEKKKVKKMWENPSNPIAPAGGNKHVAVTPETDENKDRKDKNVPSLKEDKKKDKRTIGEFSSVTGQKKWWQRKRKR